MGFSVMLRGAEKLVPAEYWCPYGTYDLSSLLKDKYLWGAVLPQAPVGP